MKKPIVINVEEIHSFTSLHFDTPLPKRIVKRIKEGEDFEVVITERAIKDYKRLFREWLSK